MKQIKYTHNEQVHNMTAPNIIVPIVLKHLPITIKTVVDFGCGIGTWLKAFKQNGVEEVLGLDGEWCNTELLFKYINQQEFMYVDMEKPIKLGKKYNLVISLEVVEHISEASADVIVQSLVDAGNIILFSAAIPAQGGDHHLNEQWASYWRDKFQKHDFLFYDVIRHQIWNNPNIEFWYKQNMFIVAHKSIEISTSPKEIIDIVHPELFFSKIKAAEERGVRASLRMLKRGLILFLRAISGILRIPSKKRIKHLL